MKIFITGGSGFIGTNLVNYYLSKNYEVFNLDKKPPRNSDHKKHWYKVDVCNFNDFLNIFQKIQPKYLVHLAARTDLDGKNLDDYKDNIQSVRNIIEICKGQNFIKRVIFASSMLADIDKNNLQDFSKKIPVTFYGQSKLESEKILLNSRDFDISFCIIRPTSIWGEWFEEPYKNFFNVILKSHYFHPGNKSGKKTFGYVGNTIFQIDKLLFADYKHIKNIIFYLGDKPALDISKWAEEIANIAKVKKPTKIPFIIFFIMAFIGDLLVKFNIKFPITTYRLNNMTTDRIYDLNKTYEVCGKPPFELKTAIGKTLKWFENKI